MKHKKRIFCIAVLLIFIFSMIPAVAALPDPGAFLLSEATAVVCEETGAAFGLKSVPPGVYQLKFEYVAQSDDVVLDVLVDGKAVTGKQDECILYALWENVPDQKRQDNQGNDLRPVQQKASEYLPSYLYNRANESARLAIPIDGNAEELEIRARSGAVSLRNIMLISQQDPISYGQYQEQHSQECTEFYQKYQAEDADYKSSAALYPVHDRNAYHVEPNDPEKIRLNMIGGRNYAVQGQFLVWNVEVPQDGLYTLSFKYRQNMKRGLNSTRRLLIDGELPFAEAEELYFSYGTDWQVSTAGGKEPFEFYLTKGSHSILLEVVTGETGPILARLNDVVMRMNEIYRKIIMVTSVTPDRLRDYNLDREIPELIPELEELYKDLKDCVDELAALSDGEGSESAFMNRVLDLIDDFLKNPHRIQDRLSTFSSSASSIAQFVITGRNQPLELDYISVAGAGHDQEALETSIWKNLVFRVKRFFSSFLVDYSSIGSVYSGEETGEPLKVWVGASDMAASGIAMGRDQLSILKSLIDRTFYETYGIPVNISLVGSSDMLMQAIMAGTGPDVSLFTPGGMPVNLALREALVNLSKIEGIDDILQRFSPSALKGFYLEGQLYALPDTQVFDMLFYRADIFDELNLQPPESWDDFYSTVAFLQKRNLQTGIAENNKIFEMLLLQNDAALYNEDVSQILLTDAKAVEAMKTWTKMYVQLGMPMRFNALNRFRTGEMPMVISSYTFYNQLWAGAPELDGLWKMSEVPGKMTDSGLRRTESCTTTGAIIIRNTRNMEGAIRFINWWTSEEAQSAYAQEVESTLGISARHSTSNLSAFASLPYEEDYKNAIQSQWQHIDDYPQSPASYYVSRSITNAFRKIVMKNANPRDTLNHYTRDMQRELERKRREFDLEG